MIKKNAIYLEFENDTIKLDDDKELIINCKLLYFKDTNEIQFLKDLEVSLEYKDIDGWWQKFLSDNETDIVLNYLWDADFNLNDELLKLNLIEFINELLDDN